MRKPERRNNLNRKPAWTKAATTELVRNVFDSFFLDQIDNADDEKPVSFLILSHVNLLQYVGNCSDLYCYKSVCFICPF